MEQKIKTWEARRTPQAVLAGPVGSPAVPGGPNIGPEPDVTPGPPLDAEAMAERTAQFDELWADMTGEKPSQTPEKPRRAGRAKRAAKKPGILTKGFGR